MKLKKLTGYSLLAASLVAVSLSFNVNAEGSQTTHGPEVTDSFTVINSDGSSKVVDFNDIENDIAQDEDLTKEYNLVANKENKKEVIQTYETEKEAQNALKSKRSLRTSTSYTVEEKTKAITYGVVYLKSKSYNGNSYLTYKNVSNTGYDGYTTGSYGKDAAYIGTVNGKIRAMQAGVVMDFDSRDVTVVDYTAANISHYYIDGGYLYHKYYYGTSGVSTQRVGYALSYMKSGTKYYSYDGHYFYTSFPTMIKDYQGSVYTNATNKSNPYYNYYQFLSHRSQTSYTAANLDSITNDKVGSSTSKMKNLGSYYLQYQNTYGSNALLMFGVSGNESAWGTSSIARDKNNLFGHGAVDSNPYYGANGYATASDSIKYHAEKFISNGYLDNEDWRYNGAHLGDKSSGINVRYASDPYWGEKAASVHYYYNSQKADYGKYQVGILNGVQKSYKLYKEPSTSAHVTHTLGSGSSPRTYNLPVLILGTTTDSSGKKWYKIQSDTALNAARTDTKWDNIYSFSRDYLYVPASDVSIINQGSTTPPTTTYKTGDVNGDGKVTSLDYIQIKNHIMKTKTLTGEALSRADVNKDGKVTSLDYIKIKNHIMGTNPLF